jgi:hypothetical protein
VPRFSIYHGDAELSGDQNSLGRGALEARESLSWGPEVCSLGTLDECLFLSHLRLVICSMKGHRLGMANICHLCCPFTIPSLGTVTSESF